MADENKPNSILGKAIEDIRDKVKPQAEENAENATDVTETKSKDLSESIDSTTPKPTDEEKQHIEEMGKPETAEEKNADVTETKNALENSGDDFESKYNALMGEYNKLNDKYRQRFSGQDEKMPDFSKPDADSVSAMKDARDFASGKLSYKDLFISDEGGKQTQKAVQQGYNPLNDPTGRSRYASQTQSTAPIYYGNSQRPQSGIGEQQTIGNKDYMSQTGGSTIGNQASKDESYDDLFDPVKDKNIKW